MNLIETERLSMRPFAEEDLEWLTGHRTDADVAVYIGGLELQTPAFVEKRMRFYMDCYEKYGFSMCVTKLRETGMKIGVTGLQPLENTGEIEVGYSFDREHWGKGLATEAARGWLEYGFWTAGLERIVAVAEPENTGSTRVMEKLGMEFEATSFSYGLKVVRYAVSRENFLSGSTGS